MCVCKLISIILGTNPVRPITPLRNSIAVIWSGRSLKPRLTLGDHGGVVMAVDLSDSTSSAFTGAGDGVVRVWSVDSGECMQRIGSRGSPPITSLSWSKEWLAWSSGRKVFLWDCVNNRRKKNELIGHQDRVECVQLRVHDVKSGRGIVITSSRDGTVKYWTSGSGRLISSLKGHTDTVNSVSSCSWAIASGSDDHTLRLWNFHSHTY